MARRRFQFRPLQVSGKEREHGHHYGDAGRIGVTVLGEAEILPGGEGGDSGHGQRKEPLPSRPEKDQNEDEGNQNKSGEYAFHSG